MFKKCLLKVASFKVIITICVIMSLIVAFQSVQNINNAKEKAINSAESDLQHIINIASGNIKLNFLSVDQTIQRAAERQYFNLLFGRTLKADMEHNLALWVNQSPQVESMFITDAQGKVDILFKKGNDNFVIRPGYKFSGYKHFKKHKASSDNDLLISYDKENGGNIFASRRVEHLDGSFGGLVVAVINGDYLQEMLNLIDKRKTMKIAVFIGDRQMSAQSSDHAAFSKSYEDFQRSNQQYGTYITQRDIDGDYHLFAFTKLDDLPVLMAVTLGEDDIFVSWYESRSDNIIFFAIFALFALTIVCFSYIIERKMRKAKASEEKALLASQIKTDFLAKMSHELRTPLNAIIGFSDMLSTGYFGKVTPAQVERLSDINMCGNHLLEFINDILEFAKGNAGKLKIKEELVNISEVTAKTVRIMEQKAKLSNVKIINKVPDDVDHIYGDKRKIKQMLINLISNAVKFTPAGGTITINTSHNADGDIVIKVSDTGVGISQADIPRAMEVFEQINNGDDKGGSGLGLPLCKMFCQMHDGDFVLESKLGAGTQASIILPAKRVYKVANDARIASAI